MAINGGTFAGTEDKDPTEPKSDTSKHWRWIIILAVIVIFLIIAAVPFTMYIVSEAKSPGGAGPTAPQPQQAAQVVHQPYRFGYITLSKDYSGIVAVNSDKGEHFIIETAGDDVEVFDKTNNDKEFFEKFSLTNNDLPNYVAKGQTYAFALKAANDRSVGKTLVYCLYDYGTRPPSDWRLQAVRAMQGIK